jgi:hypothetical protein
MKKVNYNISPLWMIAVLVYIQGCSTCVSRIVESSSQGKYTAELDFRECGTYAGYSIAIYTNESGPVKNGEGEKEPFKAVYRQEYKHQLDAIPISIKWIGEKHLLVNQNTRTDLDDHVNELMVIKADNNYMGVKIEYEPDPVIWD